MANKIRKERKRLEEDGRMERKKKWEEGESEKGCE